MASCFLKSQSVFPASAPPVFVKTPPIFLEALQGDSLMLTCSAHGNPRPTVTWEKDGTPVDRQHGIEVGVPICQLGDVGEF